MTKKDQTKIKKQITEFKKDYPNVELAGIIPGQDGDYKMVFKPRLATLGPFEQGGADVPSDLKEKMQVNASIMYRDPLLRSDLDLAKPDIVNEAPHKLYSRMKSYYRSKDVFGSFVRTMVNFALSGFENDCEDLKIKEFFDNWCQDVDINQVLEWIFQEFYTTGFVRTYRVLGKYEPQVNTLRVMNNPPEPITPKKLSAETSREFAERKKRWSKGFIPLAYTVLNPLEIEIKGSVFLNQTRVVMKPNEDMKELIMREGTQTPLTDAEKKILDSIPPEIRSAIKAGKDIELDPEFVGEIDYRRMPSEKYPLPPFASALEVIEYKEQLREADYSTIDGITSEILVVTVGDKDNPVLDDDDLRKVSQLFNTAQKAYSVVWNHTLKVDRVEVQNIDKIFGPQKFVQAETDMSGSIGLPRAMLDGVIIGNSSKDALDVATKAVIAELNYARNQVARWLHNEYRQIAEAFGFKRYPSVRWNEKVLKDELAIMTVVQGLVDRRIISYYTAHKMLDLDPEFELKKLEEEAPKVQKGIIGIIGSPYQKAAGDGGGTQNTQKAPKGAPSEGRPKGKPSPTPAPAKPPGKIKEVIKKETKHVKEEIRRGALQALKKLSLSELAELEKMLQFAKQKKAEELVNLVEDAEENLEG
jgi:hypothetical protein